MNNQSTDTRVIVTGGVVRPTSLTDGLSLDEIMHLPPARFKDALNEAEFEFHTSPEVKDGPYLLSEFGVRRWQKFSLIWNEWKTANSAIETENYQGYEVPLETRQYADFIGKGKEQVEQEIDGVKDEVKTADEVSKDDWHEHYHQCNCKKCIPEISAEDWLKENCNKQDWCRITEQLNDFISTTDVCKYMEYYAITCISPKEASPSTASIKACVSLGRVEWEENIMANGGIIGLNIAFTDNFTISQSDDFIKLSVHQALQVSDFILNLNKNQPLIDKLIADNEEMRNTCADLRNDIHELEVRNDSYYQEIEIVKADNKALREALEKVHELLLENTGYYRNMELHDIAKQALNTK